jgi:hypothetical protein
MQQGPFWESDSRSIAQETPRLLLTQIIHYGVHKSHPLDLVLSHKNHTYFIKILNISLQFLG